MNNRSFLLTALTAVCLLAACPRPGAAYIKAPPQTLGSICLESDHICVLKVAKVSAENGVILFKQIEQLKGKHETAIVKHVIRPEVKGAKVILDWAVEGKTAIMFYFTGGNSRGHVYIDGYWYWVGGVTNSNPDDKKAPPDFWWSANQGEPTLLSLYCGKVDQLRDAVAKIQLGEEVAVPSMAIDDKVALEQGRGKVLEVRASLKIVGADSLARIASRTSVKKPATDDKKPETAVKKPEGQKPEERKPDLIGTVKAVSADGKSFSMMPPPSEKNKVPSAIEIGINERTTIMAGKLPGKLGAGQTVNVWRGKGDPIVATTIFIGNLPEFKPEKPVPVPTMKPVVEAKPEAPKRPKPPARPARDTAPTTAIIDREVDQQLASIKVPASPQADDAEFLRRVTLDLTGRIPTYQQTVAFLDSKDPDKRRKLVDQLLESPQYGEHLATIWRILLAGRNGPAGDKFAVNSDPLRAWLAEEFNDNRGWNETVNDLLTAEGTPRENPAISFLMANAENQRPQPNKVTGSLAANFLGINLRCAECHNHPFANWKPIDFWGTAAFFGKVQYGGNKGGGSQSLNESLTVSSANKEKGQPVVTARGAVIAAPTSSGKSAGQVFKARFLGGDEPVLDENAPFRPSFAAWMTKADNPYFARAIVNRMWAHFFGRGFVNPLDALDTGTPSHPELLDSLAKEFAASGFDLKHLARCITTSKAYQRSSRPLPANEADTVAFSHMAVKALTPEVLYDSLGVIGKAGGDAGKGGGNGGKPVGGDKDSRDQFVLSFRVDDDTPASEYIQGIPQLLRLMNSSSVNRGSAVADNLFNSKASHTEAIATLYLTALSRRPTTEEIDVMSGYLSRRKDDREGFRGVLWILLNSSEFALNH